MITLSEALDMAVAHEQQGRVAEAESIYRQVLQAEPTHAEALYLLGYLEHRRRNHPLAVELLGRAIEVEPEQAVFHHVLAEALRALEQFEPAVAAYRTAISLKADYAVAHNNLGTLLERHERWEEARTCFEMALAVRPGFVEAENNLGNALRGSGRLEEAIAAYRRALDLNADYATAYFNLGGALKRCGRLAEALVAYQRACGIQPDDFEAWANLGAVHNDLGNVEEAIQACQKAIELNPQAYAAHGNLGVCWQSQGRLDEAIEAYRTATRLCPDNAAQHSNLLYALNYHPAFDAAAIFAEHRAWAQRHADPLTTSSLPHANDRTPHRRLRIGYVSSHFRTHAVNAFTEGILEAHDHNGVEVFCYSDVPPALRDDATARLQGYADYWRDITGRSDREVSELVRQDQIDILVDLTGHIGGNRLLVFARKPAPIQVTYIGYQNTTGMEAMDYRLTDSWSDPPGSTDRFYTEALVRLPHGFFCYRPAADAPAVTPLPAIANGAVTFGSFNNFAKVTPQVLLVWAEILLGVPNSRLLLLAPLTGSLRAYVVESFEREGVGRERVELCQRRSPRDYLELVNRADLALDPFPFNGHTTTCDALWQGVPVVSLAGTAYASRFGSSALMTLGLDDLIATTPEDYVSIAVRLAHDRTRLAELRGNLRKRMRRSPLVDAQSLTRDLEAAYRAMWRAWCAGDPAASVAARYETHHS
jgi:predicted O-linked N-acetylglucosamine transferase (SPINDLY family)